MSQLRLGISRRGPDGREHAKQQAYVHHPREGTGITFTDLVCGRGFGKTLSAVVLIFYMAFVWMPGVDFAVTEPRHKDLKKIWMKKWRQVVPSHLWNWKIADDEIVCTSGSTIHLLSRNVNNPSNDVGKVGMEVGGIVHDEAAVGFNIDTFNQFLPFVRAPNAPYLFVDTVSTPRLGNGYRDYCHNETHTRFRGNSYDNPFISAEAIDSWSQEMDPDFRRQEIEGEWISLGGRIWQQWSDEEWPNGNAYPWEPTGDAYTLWADIGLTSSWLIFKHPVADEGKLRGHLDVLVGEWHPDGTGEVDEMTAQIDALYGRPSAVYIGADYTTREVITAKTAQALISNRWGDSIPIETPTGDLTSKGLQLAAIKRLILNGKGRRLCRWVGCKNHTEGNPSKVRSFQRMIDEDAFPESNKATATIWPKGPKHQEEHCRDALAYGAMCRHAPQYGQNTHIR